MSWPSDSPVGATSNGTFLVTNRYDFMSRRVEKASAAGTNSFIYDGWNLVREDIDAAPAAVAIVNADFADGLDGWTYSNVTADACGPQTVANFSSAGAWLEQDVGAVAGDEYVVSFRYHPFACGLAPGYGAYPWSVTASIGDATASTNGSYAPWATWQGMSNFTFRLRPSVPGPLRIAVGGMPNPVVTHVSVSRLARTSKHYCWGLDLSGTLQGAGGIGGLLVQRHSDSASPCFSFCDANGNITDLLDEAGTLAAHYEFDSYGNATVQSGTQATATPLRFSSKYCDDEIGLYYYGHRFYRSELGWWISIDPLADEGFRETNRDYVSKLVSAKGLSGGMRPAMIANQDYKSIIQDVWVEFDILEHIGQNFYQPFKNSPIDAFDVDGLRCKIVVGMGHASFMNQIMEKGHPDSCDRFGAISCFIDSKMREARQMWPHVAIPGWPSWSGILKCSDVPNVLRNARVAYVSEARSLCNSPCCCRIAFVKIVCDSDMKRCLNSLVARGLWSSNRCGQIFRRQCS